MAQFSHETQSVYQKALAIVTRVDHLIGRPIPVNGLGAQISQAVVSLTVRTTEALNTQSSTERARLLENAALQAGGLGAMLDILRIRGEGNEQEITAIKTLLVDLSDALSTLAKSVAAHKQLRQRVRL